ncbi:hypothetical protein [Ureibacillus manganicus]|uniref:hypothetical protein n=1 Tax=Ureibacillus manganicus TaxID=1266064 RepID=UPI000B283957|nr:hypothetical protein [Ureibacillus manganicus]
MQLILYLIIGAIPGFLLGGQFGILIGIIGGLLLCIVDQLNNIIEKLNNLHSVTRKNE